MHLPMLALILALGLSSLFLCSKTVESYVSKAMEYMVGDIGDSNLVRSGPKKGMVKSFVNSTDKSLPRPVNSTITTKDAPDPHTTFHRPAKTKLSASRLPPMERSNLVSAAQLPKSFMYNPDLLVELAPDESIAMSVRDQGQCGSCYAFAAASMLADRFAIRYGHTGLDFAPQTLVCSGYEGIFGCEGAFIDAPLYYIQEHGLVLEDEEKYLETDKLCGQVGGKNYSCIYYGKDARTVTHPNVPPNFETWQEALPSDIRDSNIEAMKSAIMNGGPIMAAMIIYPSFEDYSGNAIYEHTPGETQKGGHAITIVGWSDGNEFEGDTGIPYWICRNSWGHAWPHTTSQFAPGFFFIKMGQNECGIETSCVSIEPDIDRTVCLESSVDPDPNVDVDTGGAPDDGESDKGNNVTWIIVGSVIGILLLIGILFYFYRRRGRQKDDFDDEFIPPVSGHHHTVYTGGVSNDEFIPPVSGHHHTVYTGGVSNDGRDVYTMREVDYGKPENSAT